MARVNSYLSAVEQLSKEIVNDEDRVIATGWMPLYAI